MNYAEITMWLTVINSIIIVAGGYALCRYIRKQIREQNREPRPGSLDELWRDFAAQHQEELKEIFNKYPVFDETDISEDNTPSC